MLPLNDDWEKEYKWKECGNTPTSPLMETSRMLHMMRIKNTLHLMDLRKKTSTSHETASKPSCMMNVYITQQCMANTKEHVYAKSSQPVAQMIAERTLQ